MRKKHAYVFAATSLALLGAFHSLPLPLSPAQAQQAPARGGQGAGVAVEAEKVTIGEVVEDIRAVGTLQANEAVVIATEIVGRVAQIRFDEGSAVKAGDVLLELDATILKAELDKARSDVTLAESNHHRPL
jgi:membrane fusion protein (multidrug efflux system)